MSGCPRTRLSLLCAAAAVAWSLAAATATAGAPPPTAPGGGDADAGLVQKLDAPLLFTKQFNYLGIHIYDTFYKWRPGGGIYVLENPSAPKAEQRIRAVIDVTTPGTLGEGHYTHPELSWDAKRLLFCFKGAASGSTCIYEINIDGTGLRRLTDPSQCLKTYFGGGGGSHDIAPAYLPDGRIVFTSTRHNGLVPCANEGVNILHVMNADGSNIRTISVNNVNEFDPAVLPDGRILFGRWEYIDKGALTQQSLWTVFPDGTNETALYANNMVKPEAILDARPVPGTTNLVVGTFACHNAPPRGTIAMVDFQLGKNDPNAVFNFESPKAPLRDTGESCEPWPLSPDEVVYSGTPPGGKFNAILMIDRQGHRAVVYSDPAIDCHAPMLVKPRPVPPVISANGEPDKTTGRLFVQDIYQGMTGVPRGTVKQIRIIEETSRVSATPGGDFNQVFLMSAALAWSAKNYLGTVPVNEDGSAYFEVPAGRAIYLHALDADGRLVHSMRTFIQAAPGSTRSCIGCHEHKFSTPANEGRRTALRSEPDRPRPESWGSGFIDFPSMVQPVFDRNCVTCHGGEKGFADGIDLSGGWTKNFTISYENLVSRRRTQVTAELISGIDCMNGTSYWGAQIFAPRSHGSGTALLAQALASGHKGRIASLTRTERDLVMAWIDTNGLFHGTWDYTKFGCAVRSWDETKGALVAEMQAAGCVKCHGAAGPGMVFEDDWFNLQRPELSRILRAPLAKGKDGQSQAQGFGLAMCRDRKTDPRRQRILLLGTGGYIHSVTPLSAFAPKPPPPAVENDGEPVVTFASSDDPHYQAMLGIIQSGRKRALSAPRVDMPGATVVPGDWRKLLPTALPDPLPPLAATAEASGIVRLTWERSARTLGLSAEVYRGDAPDFALETKSLLAATRLFEHQDANAAPGLRHYAVVLVSGDSKSQPMRASVSVPAPPPPKPPTALKAASVPGRVMLDWQEAAGAADMQYHVYRKQAGAAGEFQALTKDPTNELQYPDSSAEDGIKYAYIVRAVSRRGVLSDPSAEATGSPQPEVKEPTFVAALTQTADAALYGGGTAKGTLHGKAHIEGGVLDLREGGHVAFEHRADFDLGRRLSVELRVRIEKDGPMPVVVSSGLFNSAGWFLQRFGGGWRWHVGGIDCDGGKPAPGRWTHLGCTFDGRTAQLYQDGVKVAEKTGSPLLAPWRGPLFVGQYTGQSGDGFQVIGQIADVRIYGRILQDKDIAASAKAAQAAAAPAAGLVPN